MDYEKLYEELTKHKQEHLLKYWHELTDEKKNILHSNIKEINFEEIVKYFDIAQECLSLNSRKLDDKMKPVPPSNFESITADNSTDKIRKYESRGLKAIADNRVGVLLLAGGQGSRLGFDYPKGMYDIGLPSKKTLLQIQAERILKLQELAFKKTCKRGVITWYILTSEHTIRSTAAFLQQHNYFGLNEKNVVIFEQGCLPCYDFNGKILLDQKFKIARAPDGNGGLYKALRDKGVLMDLEKRGVEYLHSHSVDNILTKVADPVFIGFCIENNADCAVKQNANILDPIFLRDSHSTSIL